MSVRHSEIYINGSKDRCNCAGVRGCAETCRRLRAVSLVWFVALFVYESDLRVRVQRVFGAKCESFAVGIRVKASYDFEQLGVPFDENRSYSACHVNAVGP